MGKQLKSFDQFWNLKATWFEPPNHRRGGWSGVVKYQLNLAEGDIPVFIKRQENHLTRTWRHCLRGIPTFEKEYRNIQKLRKLNIPTLEAVYFAKSGKKAILITKALEDFQSLEHLNTDALSRAQKNALINTVAQVIQKLHQHRLQHNCLYAKHIFVSQTAQSWQVRLIDLEKMKRRLSRKQALIRDLSTLSRHVPVVWSVSDRLRFLLAYTGEKRLTSEVRALWHQLAADMAGKRR